MNKKNCIFHEESGNCDNKVKDEHIIQRSLGGSLSSREIICGSCNNYFSRQVDSQLTKLYAPLIFLISPLLSGKTRKKIIIKKSIDGLPIRLTAGGVATVERIQKKYDKKGKLREIIAPESVNRKELESIAEKLGSSKSRWEFQRILVGDHLERPEYVICLAINKVLIRAVSLDLLELIKYGNIALDFPNFVDRDCLRGFRDFIRKEEYTSDFRPRYCYYATITDLIGPLFKKSVFSHKLVVSYDYKSKSLILAAQFVDTMPWLIVLDKLKLHSRSISLLYKKALVGGNDQFFIKRKAVLDPKVIEWRTFSMATKYAIDFSKEKFCQAYLQQYGRAIYELDMRSEGAIYETLSNRIEKYRKSESCPQVKAITEVIGIRYCKSCYLNDVEKESYKIALSLWEGYQNNNRRQSEKILDVYRACLKRIATNYGMPETLG